MTPHTRIETRSAEPLETRDDDPIAGVVAGVEELRSASEQFRTQQSSALAAANDRIAALETRLNRPNGGNQNSQDDQTTIEHRAFGTYLRFGNATPAEELRTLTVSSDPQGGYLAPAEMSTEMIRDITQFSPVRALASVRQTGSPSVQYPTRTAITNAKWKGETQAQEASEPAFGQAEIVVKELNTYVDISNQLLADSAGVAEQEVRMALSEDFGKKEATAFLYGDGVLQPQGLLTAAGVPTYNVPFATVLDSDDLIDAMYSVAAPYRNSGTWAMNGATLAYIRKLVDSHGDYLWQPSLQSGMPEMLLGRPVVEMVDLPDIAANAVPIIFGDFTGYRVVDRIALSVLVNPYLLATNGITRIHATRRVGGGVLQPTKFKKLKMAAS